MTPFMRRAAVALAVLLGEASLAPTSIGFQQRANQDNLPPTTTQRPPLYGRHWMAITGKPLGATAGAMAFQKGGNAIDAACAMLGAVSTMWDTLGWGGETQALIYNPHTGKVVGINALGVAPTGATAEFYRSKEMNYPPEYGPLAAVTPGTPGGILVMLAEYGKLSLKDVLEPSIEMADGYAMDDGTARAIEGQKSWIKKWKYSPAVFLPHAGEQREGPAAGEIFRQPDLKATLQKLVEAEQQALKAGGGSVPIRQNRRIPLIEAALRPVRGTLPPEAYDRLCAALAVIFGTESMVVFRDVLRLDADRAREVKSWAVRALVRAALAESQVASAATPGRVLPSIHSRNAPPAAET